MGELKQRVFKGAVWLTVERFVSQSIDFVLGMVLARLLTPSDYGTVALTTIFFVVARSLADCGLGTALIQKKDADDLDFNSVFYASIALALLVYGALFFAAPLIARFFRDPQLVAIVRVSGLTLVCFAVNSVQTAEMTRHMRFDLMFKISLIVGLANAVIGISLALMGFGVWALVLSGVLTSAVNVFVRWFFIAWRPKVEFSIARVRSLVSFGWKVAATELLDNFFRQLSGMLIGKFYTKADLAFVEKGGGLPQRVLVSIESSTSSAAYPAFVRMQDDPVRLLAAMRKVGQCSLFLVAPAMVFVALIAPDMIYLLFGRQWEAASPYMRIYCVVCMIWPLTSVHGKVLMAMGKSGALLFINVMMHVFGVVVIILFLRFSVFTYVLVGCLAAGPLMLLLHIAFTRKVIGYRFRHLFLDILPIAIACGGLACGTCVGVFAVDALSEVLPMYELARAAMRLGVGGILGFVAYFLVAWLVRARPLAEYLYILHEACATRFPRLSPRCECLFDAVSGRLEGVCQHEQ